MLNFFKRGFIKKTSTALLGTVLAQLLPIIVAPLLSRWYSPEAHGIYNAFIASSAILATLLSLSLEGAISVSDTEDDAMTTFKLILMQSVFGVGMLEICMILFPRFMSTILSLQEAIELIYLVPIYAFLLSAYNSLIYLYLRLDSVKNASFIKLIMSSAVIGFNLFFGIVRRSMTDLIWGQIAAYLLLIAIELPILSRLVGMKRFFAMLPVSQIRALYAKNKNFILQYMPSTLLNTAALQMPAILIKSIFGASIGGFYGMTHRFLVIPTAAISAGIGDVFRNEAVLERQRTGQYYTSYRKVLLLLSVTGGLIFSVIVLCAPWLFAIVLGEQWAFSGIMTRYLLPMYLLKYIVVPLGFSLILSGKLRENLCIQIFIFAATGIIFLLGRAFSWTWELTFLSYMLCTCAMYVVVFLYSRKLSKEGFHVDNSR